MKKLVTIFLAIVILFSVTPWVNACSKPQNGLWPDYPLDLTCEFTWNPPQGDNEVGIHLTVTNNQEMVVTQFTVYLFTKTFYSYSGANPPIDSKQITIYDLNLAQGESYSVDISFNLIFNGLGTAKSVSGSIYGTWVEFDSGDGQWGDPELRERQNIYDQGFKLNITNADNPER